MADLPRLMAVAKRHHLMVIEDVCQSLGSSINGTTAGAWGLTGCRSFYPVKILGAVWRGRRDYDG